MGKQKYKLLKKFVFIGCSTVFFLGTVHSSIGHVYAEEVTDAGSTSTESSAAVGDAGNDTTSTSETPSGSETTSTSETPSGSETTSTSETPSGSNTVSSSDTPSESDTASSSDTPSSSETLGGDGSTEDASNSGGGSSEPIDNIPPETPTGFGNLPVTQANIIGFVWKSVIDAEGYNIYRDETQVGNISMGYEGEIYYEDYSAEPNSTYTYKLESYDKAGNISAPVSISVESLDTLPPSVPEKTTGNAIAGNQIHLIWSPSVDNREFAHYNVYIAKDDEVEFTKIAETENNYYIHPGLGPNIKYKYKVTGVDKTGNESDYSQIIEIITPNERFGLDNYKKPLTNSYDDQTLHEYSVEYNPLEEIPIENSEESTDQHDEPVIEDVLAVLPRQSTKVTSSDELPEGN